jgi:hypothetical protein
MAGAQCTNSAFKDEPHQMLKIIHLLKHDNFQHLVRLITESWICTHVYYIVKGKWENSLDQLWGSPILLSNCYWGLLLWGCNFWVWGQSLSSIQCWYLKCIQLSLHTPSNSRHGTWAQMLFYHKHILNMFWVRKAISKRLKIYFTSTFYYPNLKTNFHSNESGNKEIILILSVLHKKIDSK